MDIETGSLIVPQLLIRITTWQVLFFVSVLEISLLKASFCGWCFFFHWKAVDFSLRGKS